MDLTKLAQEHIRSAMEEGIIRVGEQERVVATSSILALARALVKDAVNPTEAKETSSTPLELLPTWDNPLAQERELFKSEPITKERSTELFIPSFEHPLPQVVDSCSCSNTPLPDGSYLVSKECPYHGFLGHHD